MKQTIYYTKEADIIIIYQIFLEHKRLNFLYIEWPKLASKLLDKCNIIKHNDTIRCLVKTHTIRSSRMQKAFLDAALRQAERERGPQPNKLS